MTQQNGLDINNQEQNKEKLTHFNEAGEAHMVDVHAKDDTYRVAKACGTIKVNDAVYRAVSTGTAKKGDVLGVARIAGIMGAKNNSMLIPLCHPIAMTKCDVEFELDEKNSSTAFVVSDTLLTPGIFLICKTISSSCGCKSGSPPVRRKCLIPSLVAARTMQSTSFTLSIFSA